MGFSEVLGEYRKKLEIEHEGQTRVVEEYVETLPDQATMLFCLKNLKRDQTRDIRLLDDIQAAFEKAAEADKRRVRRGRATGAAVGQPPTAGQPAGNSDQVAAGAAAESPGDGAPASPANEIEIKTKTGADETATSTASTPRTNASKASNSKPKPRGRRAAARGGKTASAEAKARPEASAEQGTAATTPASAPAAPAAAAEPAAQATPRAETQPAGLPEELPGTGAERPAAARATAKPAAQRARPRKAARPPERANGEDSTAAAPAGAPKSLDEVINPRVAEILLHRGSITSAEILQIVGAKQQLSGVMRTWSQRAKVMGVKIDDLIVRSRTEAGENIYKLTRAGFDAFEAPQARPRAPRQLTEEDVLG